MYVKDAKYGGSYILEVGIGLTIDSFTYDDAGYIKSWEMVTAPYKDLPTKPIVDTGSTVEEFIECLHKSFPDVHRHSETVSKNGEKIIMRDKVIIYTDDIQKVHGFFKKYITNELSNLIIDIDEFFEIRPISRWDDNLHDATNIAYMAKELIDNLFVPEKHFWLTPQQRNRHILDKARNTNDAEKSYPKTYALYERNRKALFGGMVYFPYKTIIKEPMLVLDITSSYIFDLLIEKHVMSAPKRIKDLSMWEYYLSSATTASIGCYKITYSTPLSRITCYTDVDGNHLKPGEYTVNMIMTSVDLNLFMQLATVHNIEVQWLYEYEMDELPKYFLDAIVKSYIDKATATGKNRNIKKVAVNSWFGDTIRRYDEESEFWNTRINPSLSPMWGIFTTAYAKKYLLMLALEIDGWYYSDTDSIICKDTPENRAKLEKFNTKVTAMVKEFCDKHDYQFEYLKGLGTFKIEHEIFMLKVWTTKTYAYSYLEDGKEVVVLKAAGLHQAEKITHAIYAEKKLDYSHRRYPMERDDTTTCIIDGVTYTSHGSFYEKTPKNSIEDAILMTKFLAANKNLAY